MELLSSREAMREADNWAIEQGTAGWKLMERAAAAVAMQLIRLTKPEEPLVFLCGSGNNGGDGLAAVRLLAEHGWSCLQVYLKGESEKLRGDAARNWKRLEEVSIKTKPIEEWQPGNEHWIVDALYGTGLNREMSPEDVELLRRVNQADKHVLAIDMPSGVNADTGQSWGEMIRAEQTVTFAAKKTGMLLEPARSCCGQIIVADIGIGEAPSLRNKNVFCLEKEDAAGMLPLRRADSHKGTYGYLLAVAGSEEMTGAAILSCRAAYKSGVGLVEAVLPKGSSLPLQCSLPEAVVTVYDRGESPYFKNMGKATALLIGPGLGQAADIPHRIETALKNFPKEKYVIMDADALNWTAGCAGLQNMVRERGGTVILTPHLKEASRLLQCSVGEIRRDRIAAAEYLAKKYHGIVVLKDAVTVIADERGQICLNTTGNHGMATAGSGDVLAGLIAGLAAQGMAGFEAASLGVWLHGDAGDRAVQEVGHYGLMASDICRYIHLERSIGH